MNNFIQVNPYQQNVDIIKGFFRKPIVLATAILLGVANLISMFAGPAAYSFVKAYANTYGSDLPYESRQVINNLNGFFNIPILSILVTVSFFLFYFFSKSNTKDLKVPATMFKVVSIISLVSTAVISGLVIAILIFAMIFVSVYNNYTTSSGSFYYNNSDTMAVATFVFVFLLVACVIAFAIAIWYSAMQVRYANSIKKSTSSIYLYKNGAKVFGILTIIIGGFSAISSLSCFSMSGISSSAVILGFSGLIGSAANILFGIVAVQYANYIKEVSQNFVAQPPFTPSEGGIPDESPVFDCVYVKPNSAYQPPVNPVEAPVYEEPQETQPLDEPVNTEPAVEIDATPKFCSNCGNPLGEDDYFCNNCGTKVR